MTAADAQRQLDVHARLLEAHERMLDMTERSVQRVQVRCRRCGRLVIEMREGDVDGQTLIGIAYPAADKPRGYPNVLVNWERESAYGADHRSGEEIPRCPKDGPLTPVPWRDLWDAFRKARNTSRPVTVRTERPR